jgi:glycosyltransferase involved in cell wall biosynthesis
MKLCFVILQYSKERVSQDVAEYLARLPIHRELPQQMAARGHRVHVVQLYPFDRDYRENGVCYQFVATTQAERAVAAALGRAARTNPTRFEIGVRALQKVRMLSPDVLHFYGANLNLKLFSLFRMLGRCPPHVLLHFHGGEPSANRWLRRVQRANFSRASRLLFATVEHASPFIRATVLHREGAVAPFLGASSIFQCHPRVDARARTGMAGSPVFLWTGRLHPGKDPLTAVRGFEQVLSCWPQARLYLYYLSGEMLPELLDYVSQHPALAPAVEFRGSAPFEQMEEIYNSADFLLLSSRYEVCGWAVLESMACGVIPVVTDIPSFRSMTRDGQYGILFQPGDYVSLASQVLEIERAAIPALSREIRNHFERALSFPALATRLEEIYATLGSVRT